MKQYMSDEAIEVVAERFRILSEPIRLRLLHIITGGEVSVTVLSSKLNTSQPNVSKHLKILLDTGIVGRRQEGNSVYYSIKDRSIFELCDLVCGSLEKEFRKKTKIFAGK